MSRLNVQDPNIEELHHQIDTVIRDTVQVKDILLYAGTHPKDIAMKIFRSLQKEFLMAAAEKE